MLVRRDWKDGLTNVEPVWEQKKARQREGRVKTKTNVRKRVKKTTGQKDSNSRSNSTNTSTSTKHQQGRVPDTSRLTHNTFPPCARATLADRQSRPTVGAAACATHVLCAVELASRSPSSSLFSHAAGPYHLPLVPCALLHMHDTASLSSRP